MKKVVLIMVLVIILGVNVLGKDGVKKTPKLTVTNVVSVWDTQLLHVYNDGCQSVCSNQVRLYIHYQNLTDVSITGITIKVTIYNSFNKIVHTFIIDDEVIVKSGRKRKSRQYRYWKNNQFLTNQPYNYLWQSAENGTAKIKVKILKVYFKNGTIVK